MRSVLATGVAALALLGACGGARFTEDLPEPPGSITSLAPESAPVTAAATPAASAAATGSPASSGLGWTQLAATNPAPAPREHHTWTVDPGAEIAYLFGGQDGEAVYGDLWAYDLAVDTWSEVTPEGSAPPARFGHNAVWVRDVGLVIFAGQAGPDAFFNDLWVYDPALDQWRELPGGGDPPVARYGSCAALGPDGRLWISHGFTQDGTRFADTRTYDFTIGTWTDQTPDGAVPVARCLHGCWWTVDGQHFVLYAGQTTGVIALDDLWTLAPATGGWTVLPPPEADPRNRYAVARRAGDTVVFGGEIAEGSYAADTLVFDPALAVSSVGVAAGPPGRRAAQVIDDPTGGRVLLFGGLNADGALADLWELALPKPRPPPAWATRKRALL